MSRAWLTAGALCLLACGGDKRPREASPPTSAAPAAAPARGEAPSPAPAPAPAPALAARAQAVELDPTPDEVPLPEDFAADAAREITPKNYKQQLDALERQLNAEK